ncbi:putative quinol monooxygenase [Acinetobacter boissieri]|uniref:Quinol monooxygenase YgiN n=1 Tax=Acinetobacter boissieri TaxID=1219383 RepID=A0A1G6GMV4_9GAMM|nr:putative quinol monooxygenase [Acinetobacter boissieri]SDB83065.1 Quinol monooxygenase YgiN [Acinetobacter boissieri]
MSLVNILATIKFPEHKKDQAKQKLTDILQPSRDEAGNISYVLFEYKTQPNCFVFQEVWESEHAFEIHQKTAHFLSLLDYLKAHAESVDIQQLHSIDTE